MGEKNPVKVAKTADARRGHFRVLEGELAPHLNANIKVVIGRR